MQVLKTAWFAKFARKEKIGGEVLCEAVARAKKGLIDADLGGGLLKQCLARSGAGKSGGYRTLIFFRAGARAIFAYGFAKSEKANLENDEEAVFKKAAKLVLAFSDAQIAAEIERGRLMEVNCNGQNL